MKGLPFCADMMLAWLADRKEVTRRLMNPQPSEPCSHSYQHPTEKWWTFGDNTGRVWKPRYTPGETVYIKETWGYDNKEYVDLYKKEKWRGEPDPRTAELFYRATEPEDTLSIFPKGFWKPGMFMPEWASRSKALVVSARPERLQEITDEDAIKEGVGYGFQMNSGWPDYLHIKNGICELTQDTARMSYATLWDSINGKGHWQYTDRGKIWHPPFPWSLNPWVWRYELKKLSGTLPINIDDFICDACGKVISDEDELIIGEDCKLHKRCANGLNT